jgi:hypothetical protein
MGMEPILLIVVVNLFAIIFLIPPLLQPYLSLYNIFWKYKNPYTYRVQRDVEQIWLYFANHPDLYGIGSCMMKFMNSDLNLGW